MRTFLPFHGMGADIRVALRTLRKAPAFATVAILTLAVGIGANTAIFSLVDAMLFRGLPYPNEDRLVLLIGTVQRGRIERRGNSYPDFLDWREQSTAFEDMAAYFERPATIAGNGDPERILIEPVSASYFDILGIEPALGRTFRSDEDRIAGGNPVTILSHALWMRRFGGDRSIVGKTVRLDGTTYDVVGVMPRGVAGLSDSAELWIPFSMSGWALDSRGSRGFQAVARLRPGVAVEQAQSQLDGIAARLRDQYPVENEGRGVIVSPLSIEAFGELRPTVLALMAAVSFVLLIACGNVANLLLARSERRQREIAIRSALGATRRRVLQQLVTESVILTGLGSVAGLALAAFALPALVAASPVTLPSFANPRLSLPVLGFTVVVALICGLALGLAPAMHTRASALGNVLHRSGARGSTARSGIGGALVVAEVSLAVVLLTGAGLMIRTVQNLMAVDPGFNTESTLAFDLSIPREEASGGRAADSANTSVTRQELMERLESLPGVVSAAMVSDLPLGGGGSAVLYTPEGSGIADATTRPRAYVHRVTPEFFETMGIPLLHGRTYYESELTADSTSIIVSKGVVDRYWPGQDPIGKRIKQGMADADTPWLTIVGVVPELKYRALPSNPTADPDLYFPFTDQGPQAVILRTDVEPASLLAPVRAAVRDLSPNIVIFNEGPLADRVSDMTSESRFTTWMMGLFAAVALVLAVVGIYGVMSFIVAQRTREFGIRLALGARSAEVVRDALRPGLLYIAFGLVVGVGAAALLSRFLESLVFGVSAADPSGIVATGLLAMVGFLACLVPAFRATRANPVDAMRAE